MMNKARIEVDHRPDSSCQLCEYDAPNAHPVPAFILIGPTGVGGWVVALCRRHAGALAQCLLTGAPWSEEA